MLYTRGLYKFTAKIADSAREYDVINVIHNGESPGNGQICTAVAFYQELNCTSVPGKAMNTLVLELKITGEYPQPDLRGERALSWYLVTVHNIFVHMQMPKGEFFG